MNALALALFLAQAQAPAAAPAAAVYPLRLTIPGVPNAVQVSPVLFRGAQPTVEGFGELKKRGVRTILSMRSRHDDRQLLTGLGLFAFRIPSRQWSPAAADVVSALKLILSPDYQPVFVHCAAGKDRTGLVVALYEVLFGGRSVEQAIAERREFGANRFWWQNESYLKRLKDPGVRAELLRRVEEAPLPAVPRVD